MTEKKLSYGEALQELEKILQEIEEGEPDVDELSGKVKRAAYLLRYCQERLHKASEEVEEILSTLEGEESESEEKPE